MNKILLSVFLLIIFNFLMGYRCYASLEISVEKNNYSENEPTPILIKYINNTNKIDSIYSLETYPFSRLKFKFFDINGIEKNIDDSKFHISYMLKKPGYILNPGDTLSFVMMLNNFSKYDEENLYDIGFKKYMPEGIYTIKAELEGDYIDHFEEPIVSNPITININKTSDEDKNLIKYFNEKVKTITIHEYQNIIIKTVYDLNYNELNNFDISNPIVKYLYYMYSKQNYDKVINNEINFDEYLDKAVLVLNKLNNSYYNYLIINDIFNLAISKKQNIQNVRNYLINNISNDIQAKDILYKQVLLKNNN